MQVMRIPEDTVLTLTSGGCNALNLLLNGAGHVVSVDCNRRLPLPGPGSARGGPRGSGAPAGGGFARRHAQ